MKPTGRAVTAALGAGLAVLLLGSLASGHSGATGIVKERMETMKEIGAEMKKIAAMVRGTTDFEAETVERSALQLKAHARAIPDLFPPDTNEMPSEALADIWTEWDRFSDIARELEDSAAGLAASAGAASDAEAIANDFRAVSETCRSCHESFRQAK
jgi:cytochrome c556